MNWGCNKVENGLSFCAINVDFAVEKRVRLLW